MRPLDVQASSPRAARRLPRRRRGRSFTAGGGVMAGSGKGRGPGGQRPDGVSGRSTPDDEVGLEVDVSPGELLAALARLDLEAALAHEAAAEACEDQALAERLRGFAADHRRHLARLAPLLAAEGEAPLDEARPGAPLLRGLILVAAPLGPEVLLAALIADEQLTNLSYEGALAYEWEADVEAVVLACRADEERHFAWLAERHDALGTRPPPAGHPDAS
ncbi:MAG: hypothetical protein QM767_03970 [Anaeromyxobacter sp.]